MSSPLVSVVINNYNYGRFLRQSIESAFNQTYFHVEVIVVDDGSTDNSRDIIRGYGDCVIAVLKENGGQASAFNAGFAASRGDIVIFLDADDFLFPYAVERVVSVWHAGVAKVQYRVESVGRQGETLGRQYPSRGTPFPSGNLGTMLLKRGSYPRPPTSGNAFGRRTLSSIFPVPEKEYRICADTYLLMLAPFYGDIISLEEPLAAYRVHGMNLWTGRSLLGEDVSRRLAHAQQEHDLVLSEGRRLGFQVPEDLHLRDYRYLNLRLASLKLAPKRHPFAEDRPVRLALYGIRALWKWWADLTPMKRLAWSAWFLMVGLLPLCLARPLLAWAFSVEVRPRSVAPLAGRSA